MSATGFSGTTSYRARQQVATPESVADQVIASMQFMTPQDAYDLWMSANTGTGRDFLRLVRAQLLMRGIGVEA